MSAHNQQIGNLLIKMALVIVSTSENKPKMNTMRRTMNFYYAETNTKTFYGNKETHNNPNIQWNFRWSVFRLARFAFTNIQNMLYRIGIHGQWGH